MASNTCARANSCSGRSQVANNADSSQLSLIDPNTGAIGFPS